MTTTTTWRVWPSSASPVTFLLSQIGSLADDALGQLSHRLPAADVGWMAMRKEKALTAAAGSLSQPRHSQSVTTACRISWPARGRRGMTPPTQSVRPPGPCVYDSKAEWQGLPLSVPVCIKIHPRGRTVCWKMIGDLGRRQIIPNVVSQVSTVLWNKLIGFPL